jgi:alkanesulfonate monooxygenase
VRTPRLAAANAAEFNMPVSSPEATAEQYGRVRAACEAAGRDPGGLVLSAAQVVCCATTTADLERRAAAIGREVDELAANGLCGTPEQVVAKLATFAEAGCTRAYLQVLDLADLEHLSLLGESVLPAVADL